MWIFASTNRVAVWKDMAADNAHHFASMTTRVSWQACVGFRMDIPRAHPVTDLEFWRGWCRAFVRRAAANHICHLRGRNRLFRLLRRCECAASREFLLGRNAVVQHHVECHDPEAVVTCVEIFWWR